MRTIYYFRPQGIAGIWKGLTPHKNTFGAVASAASFFWLHAFFSKELSKLKVFSDKKIRKKKKN